MNPYSSLINNVTAYFSPENVFKMFKMSPLNLPNSVHAQYFAESKTTSFFLDTYQKLNTQDADLVTSSSKSMSNLANLYVGENKEFKSFSELFTQLMKDLASANKSKSNFDIISKILPDHYRELEMFEVLSVNIDNSLYENLGVPEFKLYYPEPFVASPNFQHEEVWFLHILHYQHWL